jgi:hypothetical protein
MCFCIADRTDIIFQASGEKIINEIGFFSEENSGLE